MATQPLTHHEILGLVAPFTREGRHLDLAASNRLERQLLFKPVDREGDTAADPVLRETLKLENPRADRWRLTRLVAKEGAEASLEVTGAQPADLLARVQAVAPRRQFQAGDGFLIAWSHRLDEQDPTRLVVSRGVTRVGGLTLTLEVPALRGASATLTLKAGEGAFIELPEDLLSVLGWPWSRLSERKDGWTCSVRLARSEPRRSEDAERKLAQAAAHLAVTLAQPPAAFHDRLARARWGVTLRRGTPLLLTLLLIAGAVAIPSLHLPADSLVLMMLFHAPPVLLVLVFCLPELPRIEVPPLPRRSTAPAWQRASAG